MARSRKRLPIGGITKAASDKAWKRLGHRATRKRTRQRLAAGRIDALPVVCEVTNVWYRPKGGKQYNRCQPEQVVRK